jgi:hypothetical protein
MLGWFVSLSLALLIALGSLVPGVIDRTLTEELQKRLGSQGTASVHVEGDPLLQLPFGYIPKVEARLTGYKLQEFAVHQVDLRLNDLHLDPGQMFNRRAVLQGPVGASLAIRLNGENLQQAVTALESRGLFRNLHGEVEFFGRRLGGTVNIQTPTVQLSDDRLGVSGQAEIMETGVRLPFTASAGLAIANRSQVILERPELAVNGRTIPPALFTPQLARFNPLLDLRQLKLPAGEWALTGLQIKPEGLVVKADGKLTALPTQM